LSKTHDMGVLDENLKKFFSNFIVKQWGVGKKQSSEVTLELNEPFAGFIKSNNFVNGRGERTHSRSASPRVMQMSIAQL